MKPIQNNHNKLSFNPFVHTSQPILNSVAFDTLLLSTLLLNKIIYQSENKKQILFIQYLLIVGAGGGT